MKMEQLDQVHDLKQQIEAPTRFNLIEPCIIRTQFAAKRDPSFNSYLRTSDSDDRTQTQLKTHGDSTNSSRNRADDTDQSAIFGAASYFGDLNDDANVSPMQNGSSKVVDLTAVSRLSSVSSSIDAASCINRARSFNATPPGSSEASWNSRTGLLTNIGGSSGVSIKSFSPNSASNYGKGGDGCKRSTKWGRIMNPKWLIPPRKCPCSGKKSVQVEERIVQVKTPRMVDLRRSPSSGSRSNASSLYSTRQSSPCNKRLSGSSKVVDSLKLVVDHGSDLIVTSGITSHGFTFPILDDQPVAAKKMFNVIATDQQQVEPSRGSLEVFQAKSHMSPRSRRMSCEDENVSDGSSDLFEIESFSATYQCNRDSVDDNEIVGVDNSKKFGLIEVPMMDVVASNECIAPSQVSAEGFDRASLTDLSVSESEIGSAAMKKAADKNGGGGVREDEGKNGGGLLMSCRCEKVVSVGSGPIKCPADGPTVKVARHVGGRPNVRQEGKLDMVAQDGNNGDGKVGLVVGRQIKV